MEIRFEVISLVIGSEGHFNIKNHNANTTEPHWDNVKSYWQSLFHIF